MRTCNHLSGWTETNGIAYLVTSSCNTFFFIITVLGEKFTKLMFKHKLILF